MCLEQRKICQEVRHTHLAVSIPCSDCIVKVILRKKLDGVVLLMTNHPRGKYTPFQIYLFAKPYWSLQTIITFEPVLQFVKSILFRLF